MTRNPTTRKRAASTRSSPINNKQTPTSTSVKRAKRSNIEHVDEAAIAHMPEPVPVSRSPSRLPHEIWEMVMQDMPLSDMASLGVTMYSLYELIGRDALKLLRQPSQHIEQLKFSFRLWEKFPGRSLCSDCLTYHDDDADTADRLALHDAEKARSWESERFQGPSFYLTSTLGLTWSQMKTLVETARRDMCFMRLSIHTSLQQTALGISDGFESGRGWHMEDMVRGDEDMRFMLCINYTRPATTKVLQHPWTIPLLTLCLHCDGSPVISETLGKTISRLPPPWDEFDDEYTNCSETWRCTLCPTEFSVHANPIDLVSDRATLRANYEIVVTRFIDLGTFGSPHCRDWRALTTHAKAGIAERKAYDIGQMDAINLRVIDVGHDAGSHSLEDDPQPLIPTQDFLQIQAAVLEALNKDS